VRFAACIFGLAWAASAASQRFDFGPTESPLEPGYVAVTPDQAYSKSRGYGFLAPPAESGVIDASLTRTDERFRKPWRVEHGIASLSPLTRDYVAGPEIRFRADLPNGKYEVTAILGYKHGIHHVNADANGVRVASDLSVYTLHYAYRGFREDTSIGASYRLRFPIEVRGGNLELRLSGDQSRGKQAHVIKTRAGTDLRFETGDSFTVAGLMGLRIRPWQAPSSEAWTLFEKAGRADTPWREEARLLALARRAVKPGDDLAEEIALVQEARGHFYERSSGNNEMGTIAGFYKAHSIWRQFGPGHPFHDKGLIYTGRMFAGSFPFSPTPTSEYGRELLRDVEKRHPRDPYVRLYLHNEWSPKDWKLNEYPAPPDAPQWAALLRRAWNQNLDFAEYWADFRQRPDGSLGGGWNDDVEIMPVWVLNWFVNPDASPKVARMLERFTEGFWTSGNLDHRRVFSAHFSDAEHAAEDQGNSVPYLIGVQYGNPRYLNWNLRTLRFFRDYLTGVNANGRRHFRGNHFDATRYSMDLTPGKGAEDVEAAINYRAFGGVPWMVWYSGNPAARKLLIEHADSWHAAAMSTAKSKPRGIMPSQVSFADEVGGGEASWRGKPGLGAGGDWPDYLWYLHSLMLAAYSATGDKKYLEPFEATHDFIRANPSDPLTAEIRTHQHFADAFFVLRDLTGDRRYDEFLMQSARPYVKWRLTGDRKFLVEDLSAINANVRQRWPHMTTEAVMTDRIGYNPRMASYMTGALSEIGFQGFPHHAVTYAGAGRDFAALVEQASDNRLSILYYSFGPQPRPVGIRPWRLAPDARYRITAGDSTQEVSIRERGQVIPVRIPPMREVRIEIERIGAPAPASPRPDLALTARDIRWNAASDQIEATIHSVGAAPAENFEVAFFRKDDKGLHLLERAVVSHLAAPNGLQEENITVGTWLHRDTMMEGDTVEVRIDPDRKLSEITTTNNAASWRLELSEKQRAQMVSKRLTEHDQRFRQERPGAAIERPRLRTISNVQYGGDDPVMQRLDAYLVDSPKPTPVVIEYHGGGWRNGWKSDLDQYNGFLRQLMNAGYSLVSADYRMTPKHVWPVPGDDAEAVLHFVLGKAKEWNLDPKRVVLLGGSAGAHLAMHVAFKNPSKVRAVVDLWGPTDLQAISPRVPRGEALTALFDTTVDEYEKPAGFLLSQLRDASPIHRVQRTAPPVFIVHENQEEGVHKAPFGRALAAKLKDAGVAHDIYIAPRAGATFHTRAFAFLEKHVR